MNFEVKNTQTTGGVSAVNETTSKQCVNITVGVVGCPYEDINVQKTAVYEFANTLTVAQAIAGIDAWADAWLLANYPTT